MLYTDLPFTLRAQTTYLLWTVLTPHLHRRLPGSSTVTPSPIYEFAILVVPLLLALTLFASHPVLLNALLLLVCYPAARLPPPHSLPPLSPQVGRDQALKGSAGDAEPRLVSKGWVTVYRAHMMVMTVICILAVDFEVFPREFAKAETWGTSVVRPG